MKVEWNQSFITGLGTGEWNEVKDETHREALPLQLEAGKAMGVPTKPCETDVPIREGRKTMV